MKALTEQIESTLYSDVQASLFPTASNGVNTPVNVASVSHRSPFRYPGGKTWLVPTVRLWLGSLKTPVKNFVEPFAGGAIVSLSVLFDKLARQITLLEKDLDVASVWQTIAAGDGPELARLITEFDLNEENLCGLLTKPLDPDDIIGRAFLTIVRNRVQRGGILAPGAGIVRNGENGRGLRSRWYPETLSSRLLDLHSLHDSINFRPGDGIRYLLKHQPKKEFAWFIDPPYTIAGRRLYRHHELDHQELFKIASGLEGAFLMTYDDSDEIRKLALMHSFEVAEINMKNTHHTIMKELLISKDISWFRSNSR